MVENFDLACKTDMAFANGSHLEQHEHVVQCVVMHLDVPWSGLL